MDMVEKVARALAEFAPTPGFGDAKRQAWIDEYWPVYEDQARAAIAAMREPTPEMLANYAGTNFSFLLGGEGQYISDEDVIQNWQELIDAALTSTEPQE